VNLKEYQGKKLFRKYGIKIPEGEVITSLKVKPNATKIAKAQVPEGRRGKRGLIKPATKENLRELFKHCEEILIEERIEIVQEFFLALAVDRTAKEIVVLFSEEGGVDIETSQKILKLPYRTISRFPDKRFLPTIRAMHKLMKDYHALLVEINPLALSKGGKMVALDSKIVLDDNVPHPEFPEDLAPLEREAKENKLSYVDLDGEIAVIGNGAGLVMATLDTIRHFGGRAANFLDLGGGSSAEKMETALRLVLRKKPEVLLINIFGGITRCDDIARGLVRFKKGTETDIPLVVRIVGTNEEEAHRLLKEGGIEVFGSMEEAVLEAVKRCRS